MGIVLGVVLDSIYDWLLRGIDRNLVGLEIIVLLMVSGPLLAIVFFFANSAYISKQKLHDIQARDYRELPAELDGFRGHRLFLQC